MRTLYTCAYLVERGFVGERALVHATALMAAATPGPSDNRHAWVAAHSAVRKQLLNCYSRSDRVLSVGLHVAARAAGVDITNTKEPSGARAVAGDDPSLARVADADCTHLVPCDLSTMAGHAFMRDMARVAEAHLGALLPLALPSPGGRTSMAGPGATSMRP
jgi:hypothetical protein